MKITSAGGIVAICAILGMASAALAAPVYWTDWTQAGSGTVAGSATGPDFGTIGVIYTGDYDFANLDHTGANYWSPKKAFADGILVDNEPGIKDVIILDDGSTPGTHTITFSTGVVNPVMAIIHLGTKHNTPATYNFDAPFEVVASGPGTGGTGQGTLIELPGNILEGREDHGTIQFIGTFTTISWTVPTADNWHGFTVGIPGAADPTSTPAPGALLLVSMGTGLIGYLRRGRLL